jgi:hypothetical protein
LLRHLGSTCKALYAFCHSDDLWKALFIEWVISFAILSPSLEEIWLYALLYQSALLDSYDLSSIFTSIAQLYFLPAIQSTNTVICGQEPIQWKNSCYWLLGQMVCKRSRPFQMARILAFYLLVFRPGSYCPRILWRCFLGCPSSTVPMR